MRENLKYFDGELGDIPGIPDHIKANFEVFDFHLADEEMKRIDDLPKDRRQIDPAFAPDWD